MRFYWILIVELLVAFAKAGNANNAMKEGVRILIIHGGAGDISPDHAERKKIGMVESIRTGYQILQQSDDPEGAVIEAIKVMENSRDFNAGIGSVPTISGEAEMDALIINGTDLSAGGVGGVRHIKHPILLAKLVKDTSPHALLVGYEAEIFGLNGGITLVPTKDLVANASIMMDDEKEGSSKSGTVGAVAINSRGEIFAGTSTGGMRGKLDGRVGDTPIIGAGTLADNFIAGISATGWGEPFMRFRVASRIADLIERGFNATAAIRTVLAKMERRIPGATGGAIAITREGDVGFEWNSDQMAWAYTKGVDIHYGVNRGEERIEPLLLSDNDIDNNNVVYSSRLSSMKYSVSKRKTFPFRDLTLR